MPEGKGVALFWRAVLGVLAVVALGAFVGGAIGYASYKPASCEPTGMWDAPCDFGPAPDIAAGAVLGGGVGLVAGVVIFILVAPRRPR